MVKRICSLLLFTFCFMACDGNGDGCQEGYIIQYGPEGSTFCVEEFEEGITTDFPSGAIYYHRTHGVITYFDDVWTNRFNQVVRP